MNRLRKPKNASLWHWIPLAIGLHGLVLWLPIDQPKPAEKAQSAPIKTVPLLKPLSPLAGLPKPSPTKPPTPAVSIPPKPSVRKASAATQRSPLPAPATPKPTPKTTPAVQPTPIPSPDVFQIQGAIACDGVKDCYTSAETNGREVSQTLAQQLEAQGYVLEPLDLNDDTGMTIYHLFQNGQPKDYLHIIWTDQGTRSLRLPQPVIDRQQLAAIARLPI